MTTQAPEKIVVVYDDKCPVCRTYCRNVRLDDPATALELVDARKDSALMDDITARGLDIDQGMVVKIGDTLYYGSDAMHQIGLRAQKRGWLALINRLFFRTRTRAGIFYPAGKAVRNFILRLLGIAYIHNLRKRD